VPSEVGGAGAACSAPVGVVLPVEIACSKIPATIPN